MKSGAVICEYNPFHNGHAWQLSHMKNELGLDFCLAIMSGNFVQRGEPAVFDKYLRARMALLNGADLVIELPSVFATASAGEFARAGVEAAYLTGVCSALCFGTEGGAGIESLEKYTEVREKNSAVLIREGLRRGMSYPAALGLGTEDGSYAAMHEPNNILAAEYLRALKDLGERTGCTIEPYAIGRVGSSHRDKEPGDGGYASATAIRSIIRECGPDRADQIKKYVPANVFGLYLGGIGQMTSQADGRLGELLGLRLLDAKYGCGRSLGEYMDVSREIAGRLLASAERPMGFEERIRNTKTRQYTWSRISRALLHIVLDITVDEFMRRKNGGYIEYLRIIGMRKTASEKGFLRELKNKAGVPVVSKAADYRELLGRDIYRDSIYYMLNGGITEYERSPVIIDE